MYTIGNSVKYAIHGQVFSSRLASTWNKKSNYWCPHSDYFLSLSLNSIICTVFIYDGKKCLLNVVLSNNIPFYHMNSNLRKSFYNFRLSKFVQKIMLTSFPTIEIAWKNEAGLLTVSGVFSSKYSSLYRIWQILGMKYQQGPLVFPLKETLTSFEFRYWIKFLHFF